MGTKPLNQRELDLVRARAAEWNDDYNPLHHKGDHHHRPVTACVAEAIEDRARLLATIDAVTIDQEALVALARALRIGAVSYDGDGWYASDAGLIEEGDDIDALFTVAVRTLDRFAGESS